MNCNLMLDFKAVNIKNFIKDESDVLQPYNDSVSTYELLMRYLTLDNSEEIFKVYANAYSWSLLKLGFKNENISSETLFENGFNPNYLTEIFSAIHPGAVLITLVSITILLSCFSLEFSRL